MSKPRLTLTLLLTTTAVISLNGRLALAEPAKASPAKTAAATPAPQQVSTEELLRNLQCMEQRVRALESKLKSQQPAPSTETQGGATEVPKPFPMRMVRGEKPNRLSQTNEPAAGAGAPDSSVKPETPAKPETLPTAPATPSKTAADPCAPAAKSAATAQNGKTGQKLLPPLPGGSAPAAGASPAPTQQDLLPPLPGGPASTPNPSTPAGKGILGSIDSPVPGLSIGAYGEIKYGAIQNPAASGQWQNGFDAHRLVLLPTYAITPNIIFNAEIEFEHGGIAFDSDDKLHGSVDVEQIFVDFLISDKLNWRAPGIDLVPIGYINQHHEPTQFYSVKRPELYNGLIPSTWRVPATSIYGTIADGIKYQLQMSSSLEDFGDDFGLRTDANTVPISDPITGLPIPYGAGITGLEALGLSRPVVGDFRQLSNDLAWAGKLDFSPPAIPGLGFSLSAYYTPNTTPRGAHDNFGNPLGRSSLTMFDAEFRYRIPKTWVELRGEYVRTNFGSPVNLRANNDGDPTNNVGSFMYGYSGEIALHIPLGTILSSEWKAVPFYRYTYQNFQTCGYGQPSGVTGTDFCLSTGAGQTRFQDFGVAVFPSPKIVLKATYQRVRNNDPLGAQSDSILGGVGFFF